MSYEAIEGWLDTATQYAQQLLPVAQISAKVLADPFLPETACEVTRLSKAQAGMNPGPSCARTVSSSSAGVGLRYVVSPLRVYVWHRQHPMVIPAAAIAGLALLFYAGYESGRSKR